MKKMILFSFLLAFFFTGALAHGHSLWMNVDNDRPDVGQAVQIEIGWGHKFPRDEVIKKEMLNEVYALNSNGARVPLRQISTTLFEFIPSAEGIYTVLANIHPGFLSKTTEGYKLQSKKGLDDVVSCFRFDIRAKVFIHVGDKGQTSEKAVGDPLEIVPLMDPSQLGEGAVLPVKVLFQGEFLHNADVKATYEGFSDQPMTFAFATKTDREGVARIKILKKGNWIVNVLHEVPYPDRDECDKYRYNYSFTFRVK